MLQFKRYEDTTQNTDVGISNLCSKLGVETPLILDSHVPKEPGLLKARGLFYLN